MKAVAWIEELAAVLPELKALDHVKSDLKKAEAELKDLEERAAVIRASYKQQADNAARAEVEARMERELTLHKEKLDRINKLVDEAHAERMAASTRANQETDRAARAETRYAEAVRMHDELRKRLGGGDE